MVIVGIILGTVGILTLIIYLFIYPGPYQKEERPRRHVIKFTIHSYSSTQRIARSVHNICDDLEISVVSVYIARTYSEYGKSIVKCTDSQFHDLTTMFVSTAGHEIQSLKY